MAAAKTTKIPELSNKNKWKIDYAIEEMVCVTVYFSRGANLYCFSDLCNGYCLII